MKLSIKKTSFLGIQFLRIYIYYIYIYMHILLILYIYTYVVKSRFVVSICFTIARCFFPEVQTRVSPVQRAGNLSGGKISSRKEPGKSFNNLQSPFLVKRTIGGNSVFGCFDMCLEVKTLRNYGSCRCSCKQQ